MPNRKIPLSGGWNLAGSFKADLPDEEVTIRVHSRGRAQTYWLTSTGDALPSFEGQGEAAPSEGNMLEPSEIIPLRANERVWFASPATRSGQFLVISY